MDKIEDRLAEALKDLEFAYINKDVDYPHDFEIEAVAKTKQSLSEYEQSKQKRERYEMTERELALEAFNGLDGWLHFLKNMLDEPDEITMYNLPSIRADLKGACKEIREHSLTIKQALQQPEPEVITSKELIKFFDDELNDHFETGVCGLSIFEAFQTRFSKNIKIVEDKS